VKVLFLSQIVPYPPHGGVLQRGFHLLRELARRAEVDVLAFTHPDVLPDASALEESRIVLGRFCRRVEYFTLWPKLSWAHRLAALSASACSALPFSVIAHRSASFQRAVEAALDRGDVDLVHVDTVALSQFVADGWQQPAVLTHHNVESMLMWRRAQVEKGPLARRFLTRESSKLSAYEARESRRYVVNIVVSVNDEAALKARVPGIRTALVPNGVDTEYFSQDSSSETPALVYAGGMNMFANRDAVMHFLEEIWPLVCAARPDVRFYAVGQDPPPELQAFAARDSQVTVTGYVDDIRPFVRKSAVYVVPLRVGGGTRLKVLDAMAMGKALVSTSIGCEGIDVRPGEHLLTADTPDDFARATLALLESPERRADLGAAARRLVERQYAWSVVGDQLLNAYAEALGSRHMRS
jgi:polysaccharide biosynthesis protein PslH